MNLSNLCSPKSEASRAGRPRDPAKSDAILAAARAAFFERGYANATIEDIAQRAGVSKVTVYDRFGDKDNLFSMVVSDQIAGMVAAAFDRSGDADPDELEAQLNGFGEALIAFLLRPEHIVLERVLAPEFAARPEMAHRYFNAGPAQCRAKLAEVLARAGGRGIIDVPDPTKAAEDLLVLWKGFADIELKCGIANALAPDVLPGRIAHGTRTFLRAYRPVGEP